MKKTALSEASVPLAAEDKYLIVGVREAHKVAPSAEDAAMLGQAIRDVGGIFGGMVPVFDVRGLQEFFTDVEAFIYEVVAPRSNVTPRVHFLASPQDREFINVLPLDKRKIEVLYVHRNPIVTHPLRLDALVDCHSDAFNLASLFEQEALCYEEFHESDPPSPYAGAEMDGGLQTSESKNPFTTTNFLDAMVKIVAARGRSKIRRLFGAKTAESFVRTLSSVASRYEQQQDSAVGFYDDWVRAGRFDRFLRGIHQHSLCIEFSMQLFGDRISCLPYHSNSVHSIERARGTDLILGRPGVIARTTCAVLSTEIQSFEELLNKRRLREGEIQKFLESHPNFLRGLNYKNIYPQLVLQRDDGSSLIPDFILEPLDGEWCDILDVKLPTQRIAVGRKDRATLAAGIHELAAQLREYAAYFEQEKYRAFVRDRYGLRVYRPRLIGLVGSDMRQMEAPELRRAMTAYESFSVLTFPQLLDHSRSRLLI